MHTSILVSSVCVPGLWKCQISGLEGRGPPPGDTQKQEGVKWDGPISALFSPSRSLLLLPNLPPSLVKLKLRVYQKHYFVSIFWKFSLLLRFISNPPSLLLLLHLSFHLPSSFSSSSLPAAVLLLLHLPHFSLFSVSNPPTHSSSQIKKMHKVKMAEWLPTRKTSRERMIVWGLDELQPRRRQSPVAAHKKPMQASLTRYLWPKINNCKQASANMN